MAQPDRFTVVSVATGRTQLRRGVLGVVVFALAVGGWAALIRSDPAYYLQQGDTVVYRQAGAAALHGESLYGTGWGPTGLPFTYPPFAALLFAGLSPLPFGVWQALLLLGGLVSVVAAVRAAAVLAGRTDLGVVLVVAGVALWLEPVGSTVFFGQLNLVLLAVVMIDLCRPDSARWKGLGIGLAAAIKLTPLVFLPYLWFSGRRHAALLGLAAFGATVALGFGIVPGDSATYWGGGFAHPGDGPERLVNQSLNGAWHRLLPDGGGRSGWWLLSVVVIGVAGLVAGVAASRRGQELLGVVIVATVGLLASPVSWTHHWVWLIPALVLIPTTAWPVGVRALLGVAAVGVFGWWPLRLGVNGGVDGARPLRPSGWLRIAAHNDGRELHWGGWPLVYGNLYVLVGVIIVAAALVPLPSMIGPKRRATSPSPRSSPVRGSVDSPVSVARDP
jgi:alpha-1,2-mannosyltransferase